MKNIHKKIIAIVAILIALGMIGFMNMNLLTKKSSVDKTAKACEENNGKWLSEYNECEWVGKDWCEKNGGTFLECESACRHDPKAQICTLQCVLVCKF